MAEKAPMPVDMKSTGDQKLQITWSDGHVSEYHFRFLRGSCPCAECVDEISGKRLVYPNHVPDHVRPLQAAPVGRYAYQFYWSDGHTTGIYTYEYLRSICQCKECVRKPPEEPAASE